MDEARRIEAHVAAYRWLLGDTDVAPVTGRRVPALTARDLAIEQAPGRDHAEQNTHPYNDPERLYPEAVFDAISWARGQLLRPPVGLLNRGAGPRPLRPPGAVQSRGRDERCGWLRRRRRRLDSVHPAIGRRDLDPCHGHANPYALQQVR